MITTFMNRNAWGKEQGKGFRFGYKFWKGSSLVTQILENSIFFLSLHKSIIL